MGTEDADRLFASKGLNRVVSGSHPEVLGKMFWAREFTFGEQRGFTRPLLLADELQERGRWPGERCTYVDSEWTSPTIRTNPSDLQSRASKTELADTPAVLYDF